jgi:DNA-damage-inducible protein D
MRYDLPRLRLPLHSCPYFAAFAASVQEYINNQEDIDRVSLRTEISEHEKTLSSVAKRAGVQRYDYFQNSGYRGLYNMPIQDIRSLRGIPKSKPLFDYMGAEELGANIFRITQTEAKIKRESIQGQGPLEAAAEQVGKDVRDAIRSIGGTMPEDLPVAEDIKHIKSDLKKTSRQFSKTDKNLISENHNDTDPPELDF